MPYNKAVLAELGRQAAHDHIHNGVDLTEAVVKVASRHPLTSDHVERVCNSANLSVNKALMEKSAYTTFSTAKPHDVVRQMGIMTKQAGFFDFGSFSQETDGEMDKTAAALDGDLLSKVASFYDVEYHESGVANHDENRLVHVLGVIGLRSLDGLAHVKEASDMALDSLYREARTSLLSGVPREDVVEQVLEASPGEAPAILDRLEAESLLPKSNYDDAGPYSLDRHYKEAGIKVEMDGDPINKLAEHMDQIDLDAKLHATSFQAAYEGLEVISKHGSDRVKTAATRLLSQIDDAAVSVLGEGNPAEKVAGLGKALADASTNALEGAASIGQDFGRWFAWGGGMSPEKLRRNKDLIAKGQDARTTHKSLLDRKHDVSPQVMRSLDSEARAGEKVKKKMDRRKSRRFVRGIGLLGGAMSANEMLKAQKERANKTRIIPL